MKGIRSVLYTALFIGVFMLMNAAAYAQQRTTGGSAGTDDQPQPTGGAAAGGPVQGRTYVDSRGVKVYLPLGKASFADRVVEYHQGDPHGGPLYSIPSDALGEPDFNPHSYINQRSYCLTLGCGGSVTVQFTDNALIDRPGPDLYVFEVGMSIEPTSVEISRDGDEWISIGQAPGGTAAVDIGPYVKPGDHFRFVRLTDLRADCRGLPPGADIDAVAAIGSALLLSDSLAVFFDFDSAQLRADQTHTLRELVGILHEYPRAKITLLGHTDSAGTDGYNMDLALRRARSVRTYLVNSAGFDGSQIDVQAFGRLKPIATNSTEQGRELNRRVEILVYPQETDPASTQ